ncbi:MAG TPA: hypothetical protein VJ965_01935, partial [Anaerolineales bacterium]|nr:hypothetical protein [Anaerolineales bacterium]
SVGWHMRNLNDFRWSWDKQVDFYRQLIWRAPSIEEGTALLSVGEFLPYMEDYPTAFAINTIYSYTSKDGEAGYWYADIEDFRGVMGQDPISRQKYTTYYKGPSSDSIIVQFEPENNQCLWVLTPENANSRVMPEMAVDAAKFTQLERINQETLKDVSFLEVLLGGEFSNTNTWCYFYQKSDLAAQYYQWEEVLKYWDEASSKGFGPSNGIEMLPFIKAAIYQDDFDRAITLSKRAKSITEGMKPVLCDLWDEAHGSLSGGKDFDDGYLEAVELLGCGQ